MDKKNIQKYSGLLIIILGVIVFFLVVWLLAKQPYEDYQTEMKKVKTSQKNLEKVKKEERNASLQEAEELERLKTLKPIYKNENEASSDSTGVYGTMFDEIINFAKQNSLMIRSIEYDMNPTYDPIYASHADLYNVCEFKFRFVGSYNQYKAFLADIINKFQYFISISKVEVSAFEENTDYLLINMSFTMYSEKSKSQQGAFKSQRKKPKTTGKNTGR